MKLIIIFAIILLLILVLSSIKRFIIFVVGVTVWYFALKFAIHIPFVNTFLRYIIPFGTFYFLVTVEHDNNDDNDW